MRILVIYGDSNKDKNYELTKEFINKFSNPSVKEYFLPNDMAKPCLGCMNCYLNSEKNCYAFRQMSKIYENMTDADLIIFSTPTYAGGMPGHLKSFFDHFGFLWMVRRPNRIMFGKKVVIISSSYYLNAKNTLKEIKRNVNWWGVSLVYTCDLSYNKNIDNKFNKLYKKVILSKNNISIKTKIRFTYSLRKIKKHKENEYDYDYWKEEGWLKGKRPW